MRKKLSVLLGAVLVLGITGTALGQVLQSETEEPDTVLEEAYDPANQTLAFSLDTDLETVGLDVPLTTVEVAGPNGQVNHGQVVSSFRQALREAGVKGGGCLNRVIAQSDYGKGDQQVTVSEAAEQAPPSPSTVEPKTHELSCQGNSGNGQGNGNGNATGKPDHAGRPDHAGKPAHAGNPHNDG